MIRPACGHGTCEQAWIETGDPRCTADGRGEAFRLDSRIVGAALAIRAALPWITLSEAIRYADPRTVEGRAFRRGARDGFCGLGFSRVDFAFGLAWFGTLWGPLDNPRLSRILGRFRVRLRIAARLENEETEVKRAYGAIVRRDPVPAIVTAWERFAKRDKGRGLAPTWPGSSNMPPVVCGGTVERIRAWIRSVGLAPEAIESYAPRGRGEAYETMHAHLAALPIPSVSEVQS